MLCNVTRMIHNMQYVLLWLRLLEFLLQQSIYSRIQQSILAASGIEAVRSCVTLFLHPIFALHPDFMWNGYKH